MATGNTDPAGPDAAGPDAAGPDAAGPDAAVSIGLENNARQGLTADAGLSALVSSRTDSSANGSLLSWLEQFTPPGTSGPGELTKAQFESLEAAHQVTLENVRNIDLIKAQLDAFQAKLLLEVKDFRQWANPASGFRDFAQWRGQHSGKGAKEAAKELAVAHALQTTPKAQEAVVAGDLTIDHVGGLAQVTERATRSGGKELSQMEKDALVEMAKTRNAQEFRTDANRWLDARDPVAHDASFTEMRSRRYLNVSYTPKGTFLKGYLDPVAGQSLRVALEAATPKPAADDDRDFGQRNADAFEAIMNRVLDTKALKSGALLKPHISLIMTEETFDAASKELKRRELVTHKGGNCRTAPAPMEPVMFEDGTTIPLTEVARLLCDFEMTRIVVSAQGSPMNLGRTQRLYSAGLRRAIIVRDKTCRFKSCDMQARWSEVHHIKPWKKGGETSLENGILVCRYHHGQIHSGILTVVKDKSGLFHVVLAKGANRNTDNWPGYATPQSKLSKSPPNSENQELNVRDLSHQAVDTGSRQELNLNIGTKPPKTGTGPQTASDPPSFSVTGPTNTSITGPPGTTAHPPESTAHPPAGLAPNGSTVRLSRTTSDPDLLF